MAARERADAARNHSRCSNFSRHRVAASYWPCSDAVIIAPTTRSTGSIVYPPRKPIAASIRWR